MVRLGILTSHPIQYQAPWFRALAKEVDLEVFFCHRQSAAEQGTAGFGVPFDWDVDLLSGYKHRFLQNISSNPGVNHFTGCDTPEIAEIISEKQQSDFSFQLSTFSVSPFDAFIVTGWYLKSYMQAVRACRAAGVPVLVRGDSQLGTPRSLLKRLAMEVRQRWLLRKFDGFLSVGQRHREYLEHYGVPTQKIFFAPHFVDSDWFSQKVEKLKSEKAEIRKQWKIPGDAFCVLFCGKFIPKKRPTDLVAAARQLLSQDSAVRTPHPTGSISAFNFQLSVFPANLHLLFVGSGELGPLLRQSCRVVYDAEGSAQTLKAEKRKSGKHFSISASQHVSMSAPLPPASFAGFKNQTELPACYAAADVLVLPSESETWGLAVNEAMACGLPAIVSDAVGCAPDLIDEGVTGFTFPVGETGTLAEALLKLAVMKNAGHDFGPALKAKMQTYNLTKAVAGTLRAVQELATPKFAR